MNWILANKDWLFDGAAIAVPLAIIGWFVSSKTTNKQVQRGGKNSINIQAGGDVEISRFTAGRKKK